MDVVNVTDGKHLGKVCDVKFCFPENRIQGFFVTGAKGFHFTRQDLFLPVNDIVRIGEDVILTNLSGEVKPRRTERTSDKRGYVKGGAEYFQDYKTTPDRRSYDDYE